MEKPKIFPVHMSPELHQLVKVAATMAGKSIHDWMIEAVKVKLQQDKAGE